MINHEFMREVLMPLACSFHHVKRTAGGCITVMAVLLFMSCQGCSLFKTPPETGRVPAACRSGNTMHDIQAIGRSINGIDTQARIQLTLSGTRQPWVSCCLKWSHSPEGERMRITGSGLLGISVFDALIRDNLFLLYIPSHDTVYFSDIRDARQSVQAIAFQARVVLNPWSALETSHTRQVMCEALYGYSELPSDSICYSSSFQRWRNRYKAQVTGDKDRRDENSPMLAAFSTSSLSPAALETVDCSVRFNGHAEQEDPVLPCVSYPSRIAVRLKTLDLQLDIKIKKSAFNNVPTDHPAFDTPPFMKMRMLPLRVLTESISRHLTENGAGDSR